MARQEQAPKPTLTDKIGLSTWNRFFSESDFSGTRTLKGVQTLFKAVKDRVAKRQTVVEFADGLARSEEFAIAVDNLQPPVAKARRLYRAIFQREPDEGGLNNYVGHFANGRSARDVIDEFLGSDEYGKKAVADLYTEVLERGVDPEGLQAYSDHIKNGMPISEVAKALKNSQERKDLEARKRTKPLIKFR